MTTGRKPTRIPPARYAPAERMMQMARLLAGTRTGLTLEELVAQLGVRRRTVERLRSVLEAAYPQLEFWEDEARVRRWRLPASALSGLLSARPEAVVAVETAARECAGRGDSDRAALFQEAAATLRAMMPPDALLRAETDIAALMEAEGIATRPGPRPVLAAGLLPTLRRAVLGMQPVAVRYRGAGDPATRILCPYGILHGGRGWLVAHVEGLPELRLWRLDRIESAGLLDRCFPRRQDFSLAEYAAQSFGVFQEDASDVTLRFAPDAAADAASWLFHPSQTIDPEPDGAVTIRFRAGGLQEMCWHLFTWGTAVTVVAPDALREMLAAQAAGVAGHHGTPTPAGAKP